jgi:hypothetical protein
MATTIRYTEDQKKDALRAYVGYGRNLVKTADETGIPYNTMRPWVASNWGKVFMASYDLETKGEMVASATKEVLGLSVERFKIETDLTVEVEKIMGKVIKRINEVVGQEKNLKHLTELLQTLYDMTVPNENKASGEKDEKRELVLRMIDKYMNVPPALLKEMLPKHPR